MSRKSGPAEQRRHATGATELEPLSRRCLQAAGALSLLLVLVVVNSLLNSGAASPFNPNPVAAAAERTQGVTGMRFEMTMRVATESSAPISGTGSGSYNGETNLAEVAYSGTTSHGPGLSFNAILGDSAWYFHYPTLAGKLPEGKEWFKLEGFPAQSDQSMLGVESPDEVLETVGAAGAVRRVGHVKVRNKQTTRYRLTLPADEILNVLRAEGKVETAEQLESAAVQLVGPVRVEAFIDGHQILRRVRTISTIAAAGKTATTAVQMDFFDFGIKPDIQVPDDSQVYDLTPLLEEKLDALGQAS
ncbi:MAG: hypothetical protein ACTHKT_06020 [Solirubrobacterales bacterium]